MDQDGPPKADGTRAGPDGFHGIAPPHGAFPLSRVAQRRASNCIWGLAPRTPAQSARDFVIDLAAPANFPVAPPAPFRIGEEEADGFALVGVGSRQVVRPVG